MKIVIGFSFLVGWLLMSAGAAISEGLVFGLIMAGAGMIVWGIVGAVVVVNE